MRTGGCSEIARAGHRRLFGRSRGVIAALVLGTLLLLAGATSARADGFIIPVPPPRVIEVPDLAVKYHRVQVTIKGQLARTEIDQVFVNDSPYELEGTYIFPLPEDAAISDFAMFVDGERLAGKMLSRDEARRIYESIVNRRRDPALLEYVGRNAFQASVYPIPAHGEKRVQLSYTQVLASDRGLVRYSYPLNTERFSSRPLEEVTISVKLDAGAPIKTLYSPSHEISTERTSPTSALISYEANNVRPDTDFQLVYSVSEDDLGLNVLSYKEAGEDGFFLLLVAPPWQTEAREIVDKDVILVLDTSGSMEGQKLNQAKEAARFVLDHLNDGDRFGLVAFDTAVRTFSADLSPASERAGAKDFVQRISAGGGTNIQRALVEALAMLGRGRPQFVVFLTDGLPTVGVTDIARIIADVAERSTSDVRMFTFGVGYDVNTMLLDTLSQDHRGASAYVEPGENIEEEVASFYSKISSPLLSDVRLAVGQIKVDNLLPDPMPDLFAGTQLVLVGRYREGGKSDVTLTGEINGKARTYTYHDIAFSSRGGDESIPRLWATRKIGQLLKEIRLHGENKELVDSIVALSVRYGIMTPYTSFLVDESQDILTVTGRQELAAKSWAPTLMPQVGSQAVADSQNQTQLAEAERADRGHTAEIKQVGAKAFVLRDGVWTDTLYNPDAMRPEGLRFGSATYYRLLSEHPEWGRYLSVSNRLVVVLDGTAYRIGPDQEESVHAPSQPVLEPSSPWEQFWRWFLKVTGRL
ncbi:MAG TPA: VIT domain-containing protein [Anaerolineae bacterium]|nr:VIT domain-containing protein [Anaerolineae bacterium]HQJ50316.1 VIT domain-containing protein [Anaerolineae bacterium]